MFELPVTALPPPVLREGRLPKPDLSPGYREKKITPVPDHRQASRPSAERIRKKPLGPLGSSSSQHRRTPELFLQKDQGDPWSLLILYASLRQIKSNQNQI